MGMCALDANWECPKLLLYRVWLWCGFRDETKEIYFLPSVDRWYKAEGVPLNPFSLHSSRTERHILARNTCVILLHFYWSVMWIPMPPLCFYYMAVPYSYCTVSSWRNSSQITAPHWHFSTTILQKQFIALHLPLRWKVSGKLSLMLVNQSYSEHSVLMFVVVPFTLSAKLWILYTIYCYVYICPLLLQRETKS